MAPLPDPSQHDLLPADYANADFTLQVCVCVCVRVCVFLCV